MKTKTETWVFTSIDLENPQNCRASDECIAVVKSSFGLRYRNRANAPKYPVNTFEIIILRNGTVTNQFADGSIGVPEELREAAQESDSIYRVQKRKTVNAQEWREVIVGEKGEFIRFA
jgi:hypothetical protein